MITLREQLEANAICEQWTEEFTDEQIEKAEFYKVKELYDKSGYLVMLYDDKEEELGGVVVPDMDVAFAYLEEIFDLEEVDAVEVEEEDERDEISSSRYGHGNIETRDESNETYD